MNECIILLQTGNALFNMVIYLSPADYHGWFLVAIFNGFPFSFAAFHSPTNWWVFPALCQNEMNAPGRRMHEKVHFPGRTFSVKPKNILIVPDLLAKNERVVLSGQWRHGYFSVFHHFLINHFSIPDDGRCRTQCREHCHHECT